MQDPAIFHSDTRLNVSTLTDFIGSGRLFTIFHSNKILNYNAPWPLLLLHELLLSFLDLASFNLDSKVEIHYNPL